MSPLLPLSSLAAFSGRKPISKQKESLYTSAGTTGRAPALISQGKGKSSTSSLSSVPVLGLPFLSTQSQNSPKTQLKYRTSRACQFLCTPAFWHHHDLTFELSCPMTSNNSWGMLLIPPHLLLGHENHIRSPKEGYPLGHKCAPLSQAQPTHLFHPLGPYTQGEKDPSLCSQSNG